MLQTHRKEQKEKGDDGKISGEEPEAPKVTAMSVFSVRRKKEPERKAAGQRPPLECPEGDLLTSLKEPTTHGFFQQTEPPQKIPHLPVYHSGTIAGPTARQHVNTCAWFASRRSCFREVNCVTVGGDTSVEERALIGSRPNTQLLFHISVNTTTSQDSRLAWEAPRMLVHSCK